MKDNTFEAKMKFGKGGDVHGIEGWNRLKDKRGKDFKKDFSNWWKEKWKIIKFPSKGTVFDYFVDIENSKLEEWSKMSGEAIDIDTSKAIPNYTIPTTDTISA